MSRPKLEIRDLCVNYDNGTDRNEVLRNVNLTVPEGAFISVIGPSGCGKSTLLKAISGLIPVTSGQVLIDGVPVQGVPERVSYVFQNDALLPWKSVLDNIRLPLDLKGMPKREQREEAMRLVRLVNLSGFEHYPIRRLSGGMRKRVALARAFAYDPDIYLMDEPFGPLDAQTRVVIGEEFTRIWEKMGKSVIFVTHDIEEAIVLSDRVVVLNRCPGGIREEFPVDLPRPRPYYLSRFEPRFAELQRALWQSLSAQEEYNL